MVSLVPFTLMFFAVTHAVGTYWRFVLRKKSGIVAGHSGYVSSPGPWLAPLGRGEFLNGTSLHRWRQEIRRASKKRSAEVHCFRLAVGTHRDRCDHRHHGRQHRHGRRGCYDRRHILVRGAGCELARAPPAVKSNFFMVVFLAFGRHHCRVISDIIY
jgi:hypothetical protein